MVSVLAVNVCCRDSMMNLMQGTKVVMMGMRIKICGTIPLENWTEELLKIIKIAV